MHRYWRAANYLTIGQIYLQDNPLLREPLRAGAHQAAPARPLGHVAGPELDLRAPQPPDQRARRQRDLPRRAGPRRPGDGRQCLSRRHLSARSIPDITQDTAGCGGSSASSRRPAACRATSACRRPGSIHEGGELGYVLAHAFGAAFDNPDLIVAAVVGDGEAETGPLEGCWKGIELPQPGARRRGAADPAPQRLQDRRPDRARPRAATTIVRELLEGTATRSTSSRATIRRGASGSSRRRSTAATRRSARSSATRARTAFTRAAALAGDRAAHAEGLDRAEGGRRHAGRGHVPRAPGAARRRAHQPRAAGDARSVAAQLPAGDAVRRSTAG